MGIFAQTVDDYLKRDNLLKRTSNIIKYDFNENELMLIKEKLEERRARQTLAPLPYDSHFPILFSFFLMPHHYSKLSHFFLHTFWNINFFAG